jgi:hypothetical protein
MATLPRFTARSRTVSVAPFFCPSCGGDRLGQVRSGRAWLRLGPVPLLPGRIVARHVACATCGEHHPVAVLDVLTTAALHGALEDAAYVLTVMTVATGDREDRALRRRAVQHVRTVQPAYDQFSLDRDLASVDPSAAERYVAGLTATLAAEGKERLVADLVRVALAGGTVTVEQRWLFESVATTLGLSALHLTGIISGVAAAVEPPADDVADRP